MKPVTILIASILVLTNHITWGQTTMKEYKAGHVFNISLPDYMIKTTGLNTSATIQFKNTIKDIAGFVIEDSKEELKMAELTYTSVNEFYESFIKDFVKDQAKRKVSKPENKTIGENNFTEADVSYFDKESKMDIYFFVGIAETPTHYYKLLCYGNLDDKEKYKADFEKILYSIKEQ